VDFIYLGERVREPSGLGWNEKNAKVVREQFDRIVAAIKGGTFRVAEVFPKSKNLDHFSAKETGHLLRRLAQIKSVLRITPKA
jgi:integrase